jgi:hypothetical protein
MVCYCSVCKIEQGALPDISFHKLPKDEDARTKWLTFIGRNAGPNSTICSKHFEESDFMYKIRGNSIIRFLKKGACLSVPLNLQSAEQNATTTINSKYTDENKDITNNNTEVCMASEDEAHELTNDKGTIMDAEIAKDVQLKRLFFI